MKKELVFTNNITTQDKGVCGRCDGIMYFKQLNEIQQERLNIKTDKVFICEDCSFCVPSSVLKFKIKEST